MSNSTDKSWKGPEGLDQQIRDPECRVLPAPQEQRAMQRLRTTMRQVSKRLLAFAPSRLDPRSGVPSSTPGPAVRYAYAEFNDKDGIDATRYGDWEYTGRCTDF